MGHLVRHIVEGHVSRRDLFQLADRELGRIEGDGKCEREAPPRYFARILT